MHPNSILSIYLCVFMYVCMDDYHYIYIYIYLHILHMDGYLMFYIYFGLFYSKSPSSS